MVWFKGIRWIKEKLRKNRTYIVFGKPSVFNRHINIVHPEIEPIESANPIISRRLSAYYSTTEKTKSNFLNSKAIQKLQITLSEKIQKHDIPETLPAYLIDELKLMPLSTALHQIHFPENIEKLKQAQYRLKFDELFYIQLNILRLKFRRNIYFKGYVFSRVGEKFNTYYNQYLPFDLTNAQKRVLKEIRRDVGSGRQMNRLLQGDVGSGKTIVALLSILIALDNGYQVCLMAPTEILATQHMQTISSHLQHISININLLTGSTTTKKRKTIHAELMSGFLQILIGTHALIEKIVRFNNLGLVIIDEQHRFGVAQRAKLWKKNKLLPHVLVMTATPIPRTLAMTLYGDLDISIINELPPHRKAVKTIHLYDNERNKVFAFLRKQLTLGRQAYIVYPLIKESEKMKYRNVEDGFEEIKQIFPSPAYTVGMLHGKLTTTEKMCKCKNS